MTPGNDHLIEDGIGACDHTYATDSVDGYAAVTEKSVNKLGAYTHNSGVGAGSSASDAANVPSKVRGKLANHYPVLCCEGDSLVHRVDVSKVDCESNRCAMCISDETV